MMMLKEAMEEECGIRDAGELLGSWTYQPDACADIH